MKVIGLAGYSGSGKTTLVVRLLPALIGRGLTVSTVKHAHHGFDVDSPGKDSHRHREAGATEVMIGSGKRWALMHELRDAPEPPLLDLLRRMSPVDLVLVEGFKAEPHDKIEVHRPATGQPLICLRDPRVVAIATDAPLADAPRPQIDLNDVEAIADFVVAHCGLPVR